MNDNVADALEALVESIRALKAAIQAIENYDPKTYYDYNRDLADALSDVDKATANVEDLTLKVRGT